jgi:NAD-dependent deacetylase
MPEPPDIVVLTGAGISRESGLDTFRDQDGIWSRVRLEDVCTPQGFARDPARVHAFYNDRRAHLLRPDIAPNAAHIALAELEEHWPGGFLLVTQNIDDLHERAGSRRLVHMHGELKRVRCTRCGATRAWDGATSVVTACPDCRMVGGLRPDVVWFGEMPMHLPRIYAALSRCGLFISIGTSGSVYPAAGFIAEVRGQARTVELNLEPSNGTALFDEPHFGPATEIVPEFVRTLLERWS